ncbi:hypothetical protein ACFOEW_17245 [Alteromonas oceani]|uniref:Uncharacterized protein n=1 Tax=Alteromonas oceani TaxID=2071609 RepID=A0ABV7K4P2_9ALTE|nr:hypothetical protein [Alteromonas oceani]
MYAQTGESLSTRSVSGVPAYSKRPFLFDFIGLTGYKHQVDHTLVHLTDENCLHHYLNEAAE